MESICETIKNTIITEIEGNYKGAQFELIEQLENKLRSNNTIQEYQKKQN